MDWNKLKERFPELMKKYRYAFLVLLVGLFLMLLPGKDTSPVEPDPSDPVTVPADTEDRLAEILSQIKGAGKVRVMLTCRRGEETVYQTDGSEGADSSRWDTVIISGADRSEQGLVTQVIPAEYLGAIVVCQGAKNAAVRLAIVEAVSRVTGLGADQISVLEMK